MLAGKSDFGSFELTCEGEREFNEVWRFVGTRHGRDEVEEGERWSVAVVYQGSSGEGREVNSGRVCLFDRSQSQGWS